MFDTIPILAVWFVLVSYRYSVVGILNGIMAKFFCLAYELAGIPFLNNLAGTSVFLKKWDRMHQKGGQCPPFE